MSLPYSITYMYGENGNDGEVILRFNWLTDRATRTLILCEPREAFEKNGNAFSSHALQAEGICTLVENTVALINDEIRPYINTATLITHKAEIKLAAGCEYYYTVGDGTHNSIPVLIKTRAVSPAAFSFLWLADPQQNKYERGTPFVTNDGEIAKLGSGNYKENLEVAIDHAYAPEQAHLYIGGKPAFALCTGDHSESTYDKDGMDGFFRAGRKMLDTTPFFPALGNHDTMGTPGHTGSWDTVDPFAILYKARFNPPKNSAAQIGGTPTDSPVATETATGIPATTGSTTDTSAVTGTAAHVLDGLNYFFTFGNALFMAIQGNPWHTAEYALDEQITWMRHVVNTHGKNRWKIVFTHHGIYTVSYNSVAGYEKLAAFYDEAGIDLVLSGHNHVYARSKPIRNFLPVAPGEGTVHITGGTVSSNCAWGGYVYKPDRQIPEKEGLPMKEVMNFLSLTDRVDVMNKNIYQVITIDENGINITAMRAHDNTVVKHNADAIQPGDVAKEFKTLLTVAKPRS